jgi:hypothetical protein
MFIRFSTCLLLTAFTGASVVAQDASDGTGVPDSNWLTESAALPG